MLSDDHLFTKIGIDRRNRGFSVCFPGMANFNCRSSGCIHRARFWDTPRKSLCIGCLHGGQTAQGFDEACDHGCIGGNLCCPWLAHHHPSAQRHFPVSEKKF